MIGYRGENKVRVLRCKNDFIDIDTIPLSDLSEDDYVEVVHFTDWGYRYRKVKTVSGEYKGKLYKVNVGGHRIELCEGQNVLSCTWIDEHSYPILEEKKLSEIDRDNEKQSVLVTRTRFGGANPDRTIPIEEWARQFNEGRQHFMPFNGRIEREIEETDFEGILYNITMPEDYGLCLDSLHIVTCLHE